MKYKIFSAVAFVFIIASLIFIFSKQKSVEHADTFVVGIASGYAPFVSINQHGDYEGFDIDVARALAQNMNKSLVFKDLGSMASLFTALDQGLVDALMWGLSITPDRLKKAAMIHYHGYPLNAYSLIFWKTIPETITTLADLAGKTVCVEPGSSQDALIQKYSAITLLPTEKVDDALLNIRYGKADAALVEPVIAKKFQKKYAEIRCKDIPLAADEQEQGVGIVVKKTNSELIRAITQAVADLKEKGTIQQIGERWGMD